MAATTTDGWAVVEGNSAPSNAPTAPDTTKMSTKGIISMDPEHFLDHVGEQMITLIDAVETEEQANQAMRMTHFLADNYAYLSQLMSFARIEKRRLARAGKGPAYEDMVDKEAILENALKAIDMQYKALSKSITVFTQMYSATKYER